MDDRRRLTYLGGKLLKLSVEGIERVDHAIAELETSRFAPSPPI